jgi:hypothetical protein
MSTQRLTAPVLWALALPLLCSAVAAQAPAPPAVTFGQLPAEWAIQQNVMDPVWASLGIQGVNYYAFGAPVAPNNFSARSDPTSHLYQAWLGAYVVVGGLDSASATDENHQRDLIANLAANDQRAWLSAMGDPAPVAEVVGQLRRSQITIDGGVRSFFTGEMRSHSDLSVGSTPLAMHLGMPPATSWQTQLAPFHDVMLHVQAAVWFDAARHVTIVVYSASSSFETKALVTHDNGPMLNDSLRMFMGQAHVVDRRAGGGR